MPLFRNMGSGRRNSGASMPSIRGRDPSDQTASSSALYGNASAASAARGAGERGHEGHAPAQIAVGYSMPFGLPPPVHHPRPPLSRDSSEFAWPAEPPAPHGPPRPYVTPAGSDEGVAALAALAAAGEATPSDVDRPASATAAGLVSAEPPRGNLLLGFGGMAEAEAAAGVRALEHKALVEAEHLRLEFAMAAMDAAGARTRRYWRRVSRLAEAESWFGELGQDDGGGQAGMGGDVRGGPAAVLRRSERSGSDRLTGFHWSSQWKLAGNEHEGHEPGRFRLVLQPVVAASKGPRFLSPSSEDPDGHGEGGGHGGDRPGAGRALSMEDVGLQLARKCSRYIVDIVKTEGGGDGVADGGGGGGEGGGRNGGGLGGVDGDGEGGAGDGENNLDGDEDVWGVIGPLTPGSISPIGLRASGGFPEDGEGGRGGGGSGPGGREGPIEPRIGVVEEVSSTGETPSARAQREEEER